MKFTERQLINMNLTIAKACGWSCIIESRLLGIHSRMAGFTGKPNSQQANAAPGLVFGTIPDYCEDLNSMHTAEMELGEAEVLEYSKHLKAVLDHDNPRRSYSPAQCDIWHATALQRARAFLQLDRCKIHQSENMEQQEPECEFISI